jgi:hypothetical protein
MPNDISIDEATTEIGRTGLQEFGGFVYEERLAQLQGARGRQTYREMSDNDPIIGAILFAVEMLIRGVDWTVEPASQNPDDIAAAEFVQENMQDMSSTWQDTITEILSMLVFGWSYHEIVYKARNGDNEIEDLSSKYSDGYIGWSKLPIRAQETLFRWEFDQVGNILGMYQQAPPTYRITFIPLSKCLLFRTKLRKGNPEGRSILRNAYKPWFFKKNIEMIEGIGVERDLAGLPVAWVPPEILDPNAPQSMKNVLAQVKKIIVNIRRDEQEGVVFPLAYDEEGHKTYDLSLLSAGGKRNFDTNAIIMRYQDNIAMTVLADFILLGHETVGSFALSSDKSELFSVALGAWLDNICETFNRKAIQQLFALNGWSTDNLPKLCHGDIQSMPLDELGTYIQQLAAAGMPLFPNDALQEQLLNNAHLKTNGAITE